MDSSSENRPSRDHRQECSRPRPRTKDTEASVLQKNKQKKQVFKIFFQAISKNKVFKNFSQAISKRGKQKGLCKFSPRFQTFSNKILRSQEIMLFSSRGQSNFRGLEALGPRTSKCVLEDSNFAVDASE